MTVFIFKIKSIAKESQYKEISLHVQYTESQFTENEIYTTKGFGNVVLSRFFVTRE